MLEMGQTTTSLLFNTIPPERVGLTGGYDHSGLAKRVSVAFSQTFDRDEISKLRVMQRGAVVVVVGKVTSQRLLIRLTNIAMGVSGAVDVEINGVSMVSRLEAYLQKPGRNALLSLLGLVSC